MADMTFYKITSSDKDRTIVQYRRVEDKGARVTDFLPDSMRGDVIFHGPCSEKTIQDYVRTCGWVSALPRRSDDEIANVVLRGRW